MKFVLLLATLVAGLQVYAADQRVAIQLVWDESPLGEAAVTLHARNAAAAMDPLKLTINGSEASITLSSGQWFVSATSPGYWSAPVLVSVADRPAEATLILYRSTRLRTRVTIPSPGQARLLDVYFNPTDPASRAPRGSESCPVTDGHVDCELPMGTYDLAFRIPGHASLYRWGIDLREKPSVDLGTLGFRRGATLSGRVEGADGKRQESDIVEVTLRNAAASERNDAMRNSQSVTRTVTRANKRGFFSFDVLPGSYIVSASSGDLVSEEREVTVIEGRESLLDEPLILERLWTLKVNVQVPPEASKMPWTVAVTRFDAERHAAPQPPLPLPADGICRFDRQLSGSYTVELRIRDSVWFSESFYLDGDRTIDMPVRVMKGRGSIVLGETPLQAQLLFRSRENGFRIPARSKADGTFLVFLPDLDQEVWEEVEIQSAQPRVKRLLERVALHRDDEGVATIDLRLPEIRIEGKVVDENDRPVSEGFINLTAPDGFHQFELSGGTFTINALQPGRYSLTAATPDRETEEPLFVDLAESAVERDVVLRVAPISPLRGSIASATGPVIGASVFISPANHAQSVIGSIPVDTTGVFEFRLPPQTREVLVAAAAPGFSFRMMRLPAPATSMDLVVDQNGGVLTIDGRVGARAEPFRPYVIHNGAVLNGFAVAYLARGRLIGNPDQRLQFEIPRAEEGAYSLCLLSNDEERSVRLGAKLPESRCVSGVLARHGSLNLRAPEVDRD